MEQQIRFCTTSDGVRIAYAVVGEGPPIIRVLGWFTHLEYEWKSQYWRPLLEVAASQYLNVRYDGRGMGLSDHKVSDFSLEAHVRDLEAVVDAVGIERFGLSGISQGGPTAITYAVRHPERVTHIVLYGSYARLKPAGLDLDTAEGRAQFEAMLTLMRHGWGRDNPAFRQMFTGLFMPEADGDSIREFNEMQRASTSAETAAALFAEKINVDVRDLLPKVSVPTLVIHRKGDGIVPFELGRELATTIPGARFLPLEGNNHAILPHEPELLTMGIEIDRFIQEVLENERKHRQSARMPARPQSLIEKDMVGEVISHYRILGKLGEGGMGVVYKAEDTKLKRTIALKFFTPQMMGTDEDKTRFILEAQAAAALDYPNICTVYEIDEAEGHTFIAMPYVDGQSLEEKVGAGVLETQEAIDIAIEIAEGLREAHEKGIIHRDIKSANIMITSRGQVKIMDFGLAKLAGRTRLTKTATIMGTVAYMSPEQASGEATIDNRTDIWSLGVVLYKMLTGNPPFDAPSDAAVIHKIIYEEPEPVSKLRSDIPPALEQSIRKMLQKNPQERYEDAAALLSDLRAIRAGAAPKIETREKPSPSIAVLPFVDMSPAKDQEYFCDGISESLINELTQLRDLKVIARTSAFSFKGQSLDIREIGRKLGVGTVLEGSIQKAGNRLRITAQLVKVADGYHLWSERLDREMDDVFAIQDEITLAIVDMLKVKLLGKDKAHFGKRRTVDLDAYNLYLKARYFWGKRTDEGVKKAIEYYERTIEEFPNYAPAYAGLAELYFSLPLYLALPSREMFTKGREAAQKALELDDTLVEAHVSLAMIKALNDWDWQGAEQGLKRAMELNPGNAVGHGIYANFLMATARFNKAIDEMQRAIQLDPLHIVFHRNLGMIFMFARKYDRAIEALKKTVEMDPAFTYTHGVLGLAYMGKSMYEEALAELQEEKRLRKGRVGAPFTTEAVIGCLHAITGDKDRAKHVLSDLTERSSQEYTPPFYMACLCFSLGENDQGFQWLEKGYEMRDPFMSQLKVHQLMDPVRSDPRYIEMLERMNLDT